MAKKQDREPKYGASITVNAGGFMQNYQLRDIDFSQSRDEAALGIGRTIIDFIYNSTEGKRASK